MRGLTRRNFLGGIAAAGVLALGTDAWIVEPDHPVLKRVDIPLRRLPPAFDGFTVAQLSDFHYDDRFSVVPIKRAVEMVNGLRPDLIVLTGDFVTQPLSERFEYGRKFAEAAAPCAAILAELKAPTPLVAVLGNHDYGTDPKIVTKCLETEGIRVLVNQAFPLERLGTRLWIAGADDNPDDGDLRATLKNVPANEATVLLAHEPDNAEYTMRFPVDLQLSGHSHGGQVRFPLIGPLYLPEHATRFPWGLRKLGGLTLYTNVGIGTIRIPVRLNCPPEVTLFTLRANPAA